MRAWLWRRRRFRSAQDVADVLVPKVQDLERKAAACIADGFIMSGVQLRQERIDLQQLLRELELELAGRELTIWVGNR